MLFTLARFAARYALHVFVGDWVHEIHLSEIIDEEVHAFKEQPLAYVEANAGVAMRTVDEANRDCLNFLVSQPLELVERTLNPPAPPR
jgi:hypothetical protein